MGEGSGELGLQLKRMCTGAAKHVACNAHKLLPRCVRRLLNSFWHANNNFQPKQNNGRKALHL